MFSGLIKTVKPWDWHDGQETSISTRLGGTFFNRTGYHQLEIYEYTAVDMLIIPLVFSCITDSNQCVGSNADQNFI